MEWRVECVAECGDRVSALAWAPAGDAAVVGSLSGEAFVVDLVGGGVQHLPEHGMGTLAVDWSPAGVVATGGQDGVVRLWSVTDGPVGQVTGSGWCHQVAWAPGGTLLAAALGPELVVVGADGAGGQRHQGLGSTVSSIAWTPDGRRVGAAVYGGIRWFEPGTGDEVQSFDWKGSMLSLAVAPTGKWVAAGTQEGTVQVYRLWSAEDLAMSGYPGKVTVLGWSPDGSRLSVADEDSVTSWTFRGRGPAGTRPEILGDHGGRVTALEWTPDSRRLVTGCADQYLRVFSGPDRAEPAARLDLGAEVSVLKVSADASAVLVGCSDGRVWTARLS